MRKRTVLSLLLVLLLTLPIVVQISPQNQAIETMTHKTLMTENAISESSKSVDFVYTDHPAVSVYENDDFLTEGFTGLGTEENPYVLEGKNITSLPGISISNTTAHFVIRNCKVLGAPPFTTFIQGVQFGDVRNGRIEGCNFTRLWRGVGIERSSSIVVRNTTLTDCIFGVEVWDDSNYTVVQNNTFMETWTTSLFLQNSHRIDILDNIFLSMPHSHNHSGDVRAWYTNYVTFAGNKLMDASDGLSLLGNHSLIEDNLFEVHRRSGMEIKGSLNSTIRSNTIVFVGDKPQEMGYGIEVDSYGSIDSYDIHVYDCVVDGLSSRVGHTTNLILENNNFTNSHHRGVTITDMLEEAVIKNNRFINASFQGIISYSMQQNEVVISSNLISECSIGFNGQGRGAIFRNNTLLNNEIAVSLGFNSQSNEVYYNIIADSSTANAEDDGTDNIWDDGEGLGNFWGDYDGTGTYSIYGPVRDQYNEDRWPVVYELDSPVIIQVESLTFASDSSKVVRWNVSDTTPRLYIAYVDDIAIESGEWDGSDIFVNLTDLTAGVYEHSLYVKDMNGNWAEAEMAVTVTEPPPTTPTGGEPIPLSMETLVLVGGLGAVVVIAVVIAKRRR